MPTKERKKYMARFASTGLSAFCLMFVLMLVGASSSRSSNTDDRVLAPTDQLVLRLIDAGWTREAALAVADLNQDYFATLAEYPEVLEKAVIRLQVLGKDPSLMIRTAQHPEIAGLLAGVSKPREVDKALADEGCYGAFAGMFQLITDPAEQQRLANILLRHRKSICALAGYGIPSPAASFMFRHAGPGAEDYGRWLDEALDQAMRSPRAEEALSEVVSMALNQGPELRHRMERDAEFRRAFRTRVWPAFVRVTDCSRKPEGECDTAFEFLADEPRVLDLLMQPDGERLLERYGLLAVELLVDDPHDSGFPVSLRPLAREALLEGDNETLAPLLRFKDEPLFRQVVLREDLDTDLRQRVLADLAKTCPEGAVQCPKLDKRLRDLGGFTVAALREDLAPPPSGLQTWIPFYSTYYLAKKLTQGRHVDAWDIGFVALDGLTIYSVIGPSGKMITQTLKSGGKTIAKQTVETATKQVARKPSGTSVVWVGDLAGMGRLMAAATKQYFRPLIATSQRLNAEVGQLTQVDITQPMQWIFQKTGVGRETIKRITGLEARVFMRSDARVLISPSEGKAGTFLFETAKNALGEGTIKGTELAQQGAGQAINSLRAWQQHASGWWLANATGAL
jgi:hypothetical protein